MTTPSLFISLDGTWQLAFGPQAGRAADMAQSDIPADWPVIAARVPGNVEIDLMAAGRLPANLEQGNRIYEAQRYEAHQWWYRREFAAPELKPGQRLFLAFAGLDTLGTVWLNGHKLGSTANMLVEQRFDITAAVRAGGSNELVVGIDSAVLEGRRQAPAPGEFAFAANWESLSVRKAPHMYGWDILPRLVSAGLWRGVTLEVADPTRWNTLYLATIAADPAAGTASALLDWDFITDRAAVDDLAVRVTLQRRGQVAHQSSHPVLGTHGRARLELNGIALWWPRGYGAAALYDATVELLDAAGDVLATAAWRTGFRTVELRRTEVTTPEAPGEFLFVVNGQPIFIKGTNWVPLDALHSRDPQHLAGAMAMLADLNCNMIRCWGGNVYEDHAFFDFCDEAGMLVWQDFALACAVYPQTEAFAAVIRAEAEAVIGKLRNHPSLALWAGNNEIDEAHRWSGSGLDPNVHDRLSREVLAAAVRRQDPLRPYLPSSPYLGPEWFRRGGDDLMKPEEHLWGPRDDFKGPYYRRSQAHFVSEIGYHGCPNRETLEQMMDPECLWPWQDNDQWLTHAVRGKPRETAFNYRIPLMSNQIKVLFDTVPDNLDDYIMASQISQAEAMKYFVEWARLGKWRRTGMLWWNLRDGWPVISDAVVDYYGRKKLAYDYLRRVQADVCAICAEPAAGRQEVVLVNDTLAPVTGCVSVRAAEGAAPLLETAFSIPANGRIVAGTVAESATPALYQLAWTVAGRTRRNHYLAGPRPFSLEQYRHWLALLGD